MTDSRAPYLCGGVVFFLIMQTVPLSATPKEHLQGMKDDHAEPVVMSDLAHALTGSFVSATGKDVSEYRNCKREGSINVPFNDAATISSFNDETLRHYPVILNRMREFVAWHIDPAKYNLLAKMLLDVVEHDDDILESDELYVLANGQSMAKADMREESDFHIDSLLLGLLHYALVRRCGKNSLGIPTLDLYSDKKGQKRVFNGRAGHGVNRDINATLSESDARPDTSSQEQSAQNEKEAPQDEQAEHGDQNPVEAEVITDEYIPRSEYSHGTGAQINIIHQTKVVQTGANSVSIANNTGTINIGRGSK